MDEVTILTNQESQRSHYECVQRAYPDIPPRIISFSLASH